MKNLRIRVFALDTMEPQTTVTIPGGVLKIAFKLVPKRALEALENEGIDVDQLLTLASDPNVQGTLLEVEDHRANEKIVISLD